MFLQSTNLTLFIPFYNSLSSHSHPKMKYARPAAHGRVIHLLVDTLHNDGSIMHDLLKSSPADDPSPAQLQIDLLGSIYVLFALLFSLSYHFISFIYFYLLFILFNVIILFYSSLFFFLTLFIYFVQSLRNRGGYLRCRALSPRPPLGASG